MVYKKIEEGHKNADTGEGLFQECNIVCPVCKMVLHEDNLVDLKSVVEDNLYYVGGVLIVGKVRLHCEFEHRFDEAEVSTDDPHKLVAVVDAEFDESGKCIHFEIVEVLQG